MKQFIKRLYSSLFIRIGLAIGISFLSLYLALRNISLEEVGASLKQANYSYVAMALVSVGINTIAKTSRWIVLMRPRKQHLKYFQVLKSLLIGQSLNNLYPGRVGDLNRAYMVGSLGLGRTFVLGTIGIEKVVEMFSYAVLFVILLLLIPLPDWVSSSGYTFAIIAVFVTFGVMLVTYQRGFVMRILERVSGRFPERLNKYSLPRLRAGIDSLEVLQSNADLLKLGLWSSIVWGTALLNNHLTLLALNIHLPITASLLILVALQAGISIPSVPGRFGIFEYICVLALGVYGIDQATAFSYGILLHAIVMLPTTVLGLVFFATSGLSREDIRVRSASPIDITDNFPDNTQSPTNSINQSEGN
jgi:uncharacterized protein (TIRG00374 family)